MIIDEEDKKHYRGRILVVVGKPVLRDKLLVSFFFSQCGITLRPNTVIVVFVAAACASEATAQADTYDICSASI